MKTRRTIIAHGRSPLTIRRLFNLTGESASAQDTAPQDKNIPEKQAADPPSAWSQLLGDYGVDGGPRDYAVTQENMPRALQFSAGIRDPAQRAALVNWYLQNLRRSAAMRAPGPTATNTAIQLPWAPATLASNALSNRVPDGASVPLSVAAAGSPFVAQTLLERFPRVKALTRGLNPLAAGNKWLAARGVGGTAARASGLAGRIGGMAGVGARALGPIGAVLSAYDTAVDPKGLGGLYQMVRGRHPTALNQASRSLATEAVLKGEAVPGVIETNLRSIPGHLANIPFLNSAARLVGAGDWLEKQRAHTQSGIGRYLTKYTAPGLEPNADYVAESQRLTRRMLDAHKADAMARARRALRAGTDPGARADDKDNLAWLRRQQQHDPAGALINQELMQADYRDGMDPTQSVWANTLQGLDRAKERAPSFFGRVRNAVTQGIRPVAKWQAGWFGDEHAERMDRLFDLAKERGPGLTGAQVRQRLTTRLNPDGTPNPLYSRAYDQAQDQLSQGTLDPTTIDLKRLATRPDDQGNMVFDQKLYHELFPGVRGAVQRSDAAERTTRGIQYGGMSPVAFNELMSQDPETVKDLTRGMTPEQARDQYARSRRVNTTLQRSLRSNPVSAAALRNTGTQSTTVDPGTEAPVQPPTRAPVDPGPAGPRGPGLTGVSPASPFVKKQSGEAQEQQMAWKQALDLQGGVTAVKQLANGSQPERPLTRGLEPVASGAQRTPVAPVPSRWNALTRSLQAAKPQVQKAQQQTPYDALAARGRRGFFTGMFGSDADIKNQDQATWRRALAQGTYQPGTPWQSYAKATGPGVTNPFGWLTRFKKTPHQQQASIAKKIRQSNAVRQLRKRFISGGLTQKQYRTLAGAGIPGLVLSNPYDKYLAEVNRAEAAAEATSALSQARDAKVWNRIKKAPGISKFSADTDADPTPAQRKKLPYRKRVEVFAVNKDNKLLAGTYPDGALGVFGGGLDDDDLLAAAKREFKEEAGYTISDLEVLPGSLKAEWSPPYHSAKQKKRAKEYRGTETFYVVGRLGRKAKKATGEDGQHGLKNIRAYTIDEAKKLCKTRKTSNGLKQQYARRRKVLNFINNKFTEKDAAFDWVVERGNQLAAAEIDKGLKSPENAKPFFQSVGKSLKSRPTVIPDKWYSPSAWAKNYYLRDPRAQKFVTNRVKTKLTQPQTLARLFPGRGGRWSNVARMVGPTGFAGLAGLAGGAVTRNPWLALVGGGLLAHRGVSAYQQATNPRTWVNAFAGTGAQKQKSHDFLKSLAGIMSPEKKAAYGPSPVAPVYTYTKPDPNPLARQILNQHVPVRRGREAILESTNMSLSDKYELLNAYDDAADDETDSNGRGLLQMKDLLPALAGAGLGYMGAALASPIFGLSNKAKTRMGIGSAALGAIMNSPKITRRLF